VRGKVNKVKPRVYWETSWPELAGSDAWVKEANVASQKAAEPRRLEAQRRRKKKE